MADGDVRRPYRPDPSVTAKRHPTAYRDPTRDATAGVARYTWFIRVGTKSRKLANTMRTDRDVRCSQKSTLFASLLRTCKGGHLGDKTLLTQILVARILGVWILQMLF